MGVGDPFFSGIGGLSYILIHLSNGRDVAIDGSVRAPITVVPGELELLKERGELYGYKTIAAPTTPAALAFALKRYGTMSLAQVLAPAIELAEYGHTFLPLAQAIVEGDEYLQKLRPNEFLARTFLTDGVRPLAPGAHLLSAGPRPDDAVAGEPMGWRTSTPVRSPARWSPTSSPTADT